jgi:ADP-L-glycero-D-manno-heptose 6-epimerase
MIAVTGAAGFIGSNLAHRLASTEMPLLLVDHPLSAPKLTNWVGLKDFTFMEHEPFLEALELGRLQVDTIYHLGACSDTTQTDWQFLLRNNVEYSRRLWTWCARTGATLIYASSAATYGDGALGFNDTTHPRDLQPLNPYGRSKNAFDLWATEQVAGGLPAPPRWAGMKFFNVYGPREIHKGRMASMVWHAYRQIVKDGQVALFRSNDPSIADGEQRRDFVFVGDCIDHMLWLAEAHGASDLYNSGSGQARTFLDLVRAVFVALTKEPRIRFIPMPPDLSAQYQNFTCASMHKLHAAGYRTSATSLEDGTATYVTWLIANDNTGGRA